MKYYINPGGHNEGLLGGHILGEYIGWHTAVLAPGSGVCIRSVLIRGTAVCQVGARHFKNAIRLQNTAKSNAWHLKTTLSLFTIFLLPTVLPSH